MDAQKRPANASEDLVYSPAARAFHWITVAFVAVMIPVGLYMVQRGAATNFDATTNTLYSAHKLAGFTLLWLVLARLLYRFTHGAPPDEPTLAWWQRAGSHLTHWGLYGLLIAMPIVGWLGVTLYGALGTFGGVSLPAIPAAEPLYAVVSSVASAAGFEAPPVGGDKTKAAELVFKLHFWGAMLMLVALGAHIGAALLHHFVRGDSVLRRMLPGLRKRG
ncbi:MAG: cytochrome b/b6 domain-containing protein [Hyphomicrobiaceae bacterium]|nr:cytochrome b/b6 domain-containing protein [Hyphomicrobiaceae bacterium]